MKVLLLGHKGWIGSMMSSILTERKINFITTSIRPNNKTEFEKYLVEEKPTHIMSFIGRTHGSINGKKYTTIDYLEQKGKITENVRDNLFSPLVIAFVKNITFITLTLELVVYLNLMKIIHLVKKRMDSQKSPLPISLAQVIQ